MRLTTLEAVAAILLALFGTGGIGSGGWKLAAAILRRAQAIEQFRDQTRAGLQTATDAINLLTSLTASHQARLDAHDQLHARMENPWTPPDQELPPPVSTRSP